MEISPDRYQVDRELLISQSPTVWTGSVAPVRGPNGTEEGYRIKRMPRDSLLRKLGFEPGDVLQTIDGEPIRRDRETVGRFTSVQHRDSVCLGLERGGAPRELCYELR